MGRKYSNKNRHPDTYTSKQRMKGKREDNKNKDRHTDTQTYTQIKEGKEKGRKEENIHANR